MKKSEKILFLVFSGKTGYDDYRSGILQRRKRFFPGEKLLRRFVYVFSCIFCAKYKIHICEISGEGQENDENRT